jgi:hypothetical protein
MRCELIGSNYVKFADRTRNISHLCGVAMSKFLPLITIIKGTNLRDAKAAQSARSSLAVALVDRR